MKYSIKFLALVLAMVMLLSLTVFAEEVLDGTIDETQGDIMLISEEPTDDAEAIAEDPAEEVLDGTTDEVQGDVMPVSDEEEQVLVYSPELLNLGDYIGTTEDWLTNSEGNFAVEDGKAKNTGSGTIYFSNNKVDFENYIVQFKANLKIAKSWGGFTIRATLPDGPVWTGGYGYLIVVKNDRIELQRWAVDGQKILTVIPNDCIGDGVDCNVAVGAVDSEDGVNILMFVDGKCVLNVFDTDKTAIREGQYFTFVANGNAEFSAYDGGKLPTVPAMVVADGTAKAGEKFTADHRYIALGEDEPGVCNMEWYFSKEIEGTNFTDLQQNAKYEFTSKYIVDGEYEKLDTVGAEHTVAEEEIGGYYKIFVTDEEGAVLTKQIIPVVTNSVDEILDSSIVLLINCEYSFVNGEKVQIDPDDYSVRPDIVDGRTLVPVRFIAESYGAEVSWDDATKKVTINLDGKTICFVLNEKSYTVDGEELALDVPAQVMYDRTMVPIRVVSEAFGKTVFWDNTNRLIVINSEDMGLDSTSDAISLAEITAQIQKII